MFGQLALLSPKRRRAEVRALSHGVLLELDETRFLRLMRRSSAVRKAVRDSALKRGMDPERAAALGGKDKAPA